MSMKALIRISIWSGLGLAMILPIWLATHSPFLAWRDPIYIFGCFAGIGALALLLLQPLLATKALPAISVRTSRHVHRFIGITLVFLVIAHVALLWMTSPPDIIDALLFRSPTPFAPWGVIAMLGVFLSALLVFARRHISIPWRQTHIVLAGVIVTGSVGHAIMIEGLMEPISKLCLSILVVLTSVVILFKRRS